MTGMAIMPLLWCWKAGVVMNATAPKFAQPVCRLQNFLRLNEQITHVGDNKCQMLKD